MPTHMVCSMTRPCECGLCRPRRLFGFEDGTVGGAPRCGTVFSDQGGCGLPPTFTRLSLPLGLRTRDTRGFARGPVESQSARSPCPALERRRRLAMMAPPDQLAALGQRPRGVGGRTNDLAPAPPCPRRRAHD